MNGLEEDNSGSWRTSYNACHGMHPAWAEKTEPFREWVVKDASQVKIIGLEIQDGTYSGNIHLPGCWIKVRGNVSFLGNITAGELILG